MAAFTQLNPEGDRFTNGTYGVFYAGRAFETAIAETRDHRTRFLQATSEPAQELDMRVPVPLSTLRRSAAQNRAFDVCVSTETAVQPGAADHSREV